jgi:hypothetical protein
MLDERSYQIVLQNLLNRATEIEIHKASIVKRVVDMTKVEKNLGDVGTLFMKKIKAFSNASKAQAVEESSAAPRNHVKVSK